MNLCRCPHCSTTFQVHIPHDDPIWEQLVEDDEGLTLWVCRECWNRGLRDIEHPARQLPGHDTSYPGR